MTLAMSSSPGSALKVRLEGLNAPGVRDLHPP